MEIEVNHYGDEVKEIVEQNARVAQNQKEYDKLYNKTVKLYEDKKAEYDETISEIEKREAADRINRNFIKRLESIKGTVEEFDEELWGALLDTIEVDHDGNITVNFKLGFKVEV